MRPFIVLAAALAMGTLSACRVSDVFDGGRVCTTEARFGISVHVTDSLTGAPAARGATLVIRDGAYADSMTVPDNPVYAQDWMAGAVERAGTYSVTITRPGYRPWARSGVVVTGGECHVNTVQLEAKLQPAP